jgi:hypothetical protein
MSNYTFDAATGEHLLVYSETVPSWWEKPRLRAKYAFLGIPAGFVASIVIAPVLSLPLAILGFFVGMVVGHVKASRRTWEFAKELRINERTGMGSLFTAHDKLRDRPYRGPATFHVNEIASIERSSYAQECPDAIHGLQQAGGSDLQEARRIEAVKIVFDDGQEIYGGWAASPNKAAVMQKLLREFVGEVRQRCNAESQNKARHLSLVAGDRPL